jgi:hypothetical protein
MIIRENKTWQNEAIYYMSDAVILAASIRMSLLEIAKQAEALGIGLQNAAPADKAGTPNNSVSYLLSISENIKNIAEDCGKVQSLRTSQTPK